MIRNEGIQIFNKYHRIIENCTKSDANDVTLCCEDRDIDVHRNVLMVHSPYFSQLLANRPTENLVIALNKVDGTIFKYVLQFMYGGKVRVAEDRMEDFKELLVRFRMPIPDEVNHFLNETINITRNKQETNGTECEAFIWSFQAILDSVNKTNVNKLTQELLATNDQNLTAEQIDIIISMVLQKVSTVSLMPVNLGGMAALMLAINETNSSNEFKSKLCDFSINLFRDTFNHIPSKPAAFIDSNKILTLDKQVNLIENANFYMNPYRINRIAHFIGHLYLVNLIEATDICSVIELCETKIDSVVASAVIRAMAIAFRKIHLEITTDDDRLATLNRTQSQMLQRIVSKTKLIWAFCDECESCCNVQMSKDIRIILTSPGYSGIQSMVEHMNWARFSAQQFFENDCKPMFRSACTFPAPEPEEDWDV